MAGSEPEARAKVEEYDKMMVELRHDFLSEATRVYYERRRLQIETVYSPPGSEKEYFEQLIRIEELTSLLDGMTGGEYGRALEKLYRSYPELRALWASPKSDP